MHATLRIVIADDEPRMREFLCKALEQQGHQVLAAAGTGAELVAQCRALHPDLVVTDIRMPELDGIDAAAKIYEDHAVPVILVSAFHETELIERARQNHVLAYLVKPIKDTDLKPAIALATARFREFETLRQEAEGYRQALEDRKLIERAKGILMSRGGLSEADAFRRLQHQASSKRVKLVDVARTLIAAEETLRGTL
jgi:response regulator NasT